VYGSLDAWKVATASSSTVSSRISGRLGSSAADASKQGRFPAPIWL
jgi:hypothetical protein